MSDKFEAKYLNKQDLTNLYTQALREAEAAKVSAWTLYLRSIEAYNALEADMHRVLATTEK